MSAAILLRVQTLSVSGMLPFLAAPHWTGPPFLAAPHWIGPPFLAAPHWIGPPFLAASHCTGPPFLAATPYTGPLIQLFLAVLPLIATPLFLFLPLPLAPPQLELPVLLFHLHDVVELLPLVILRRTADMITNKAKLPQIIKIFLFIKNVIFPIEYSI